MTSKVLFLSTLLGVTLAQSTTYNPNKLPKTSEQGQEGTNQCGTTFNQTGHCQTSYLNSLTDFCLWAPPEPALDIGNSERFEVAWCLKNGTGSRIIPDGAIQGVTFLETPDYVQVTGVGDLTLLNVKKGDAGGELDPHGADGNGNPIGGLVFSNAFGGKMQQIHEWTNFMSANEFCFRACKDGKKAAGLCNHVYDVMGCGWNMPGNYKKGEFQSCKGDTGEPMGVYGGSTFHQGDGATPAPHPAPSSSSCQTIATVSNGGFIISGTSVAFSTTAAPSSSTASSGSSGQPGQTAASSSNSASDGGSMISSAVLVLGIFAGGLLVVA